MKVLVLINQQTLESGNAELLLLEIRDYLDEQAKSPVVSDMLCGSFDADKITSSATKCKCGREKWAHPKEK